MSKSFKICFDARPTLDKFVSRIYVYIKENIDFEITAGFITSNAKESKFLLNDIKDSNIKVHEVSSYFKKHWNEFTIEKLVKYEEKYKCKPLWKFIYTDRFLINRDYNYCIKITTGYFSFFENIFSNKKYDFYYDEAIATLQSYVAYIVGKKHGVQYFSQMVARGGLDGSYHYILNDPIQSNILLDKEYKYSDYTEEEKNQAEKFLTHFEKHNVIPEYQKDFLKKPTINLKILLSPLRYLKVRINPYCNDPYFYMYYQLYKSTLNPIIYYIRYLYSRKYYKKADYSKKYIYFPLHYEPEASTLVCASKYEKQIFFIDSWAKSLPADTVMYVKEHYTLLGNRPLKFYKELKKYPNVILIDPWENSKKLILHAKAITTLTGTAGFEAMLLRKPVILGGDIFFDSAPGVIKVDDIYGRYMDIISNWKEPSRNEIIQYICAYFRSLRKGCANQEMESSLEEENIKEISISIYEQMEQFYHKK